MLSLLSSQSYNADFDGDEMNMHLPQNEIARAEAMFIGSSGEQYLSSTSGAPLRGLIQDHVVTGVWLSSKGTFFTREQYCQILYGALRPDSEIVAQPVLTIPPAIQKPRPLWTGKQVVSLASCLKVFVSIYLTRLALSKSRLQPSYITSHMDKNN